MTIAHALAEAARQGLDRLDAQVLLLNTLGRPESDRAWLLAHDLDSVAPAAQEAFAGRCRRRASGEPLAYIVGHKEFFGLDLRVDPRVLVPRPDTETLVEWALAVLPTSGQPRVIDLGTGSGAIALAIAKHRPEARVEATDLSAQALEVAAANAKALALGLVLRPGAWLAAAQGEYDLVVSNPPYVAQDDPHLADLAHEPASALVAGADGLRDIRTLASGAPRHLKPGGWLLLEHGHDQAKAVRGLLAAAGFQSIASRRDLSGIERCTGGRWLELG